jgi:hypothetical protein
LRAQFVDPPLQWGKRLTSVRVALERALRRRKVRSTALIACGAPAAPRNLRYLAHGIGGGARGLQLV